MRYLNFISTKKCKQRGEILHLSKVNKNWQNTIGAGSTVNWSVGIGGKGNDGVAAFIQRLPGSIGYVEFAYAKQNNLSYTKLFSADNTQVTPTEKSFKDAAKFAKWDVTFAQDLTNQSGENAWPITSATFILLHKVQPDAAKGKEILKFFEWALTKGNEQAEQLDYATLPESVIEQIKAAWKTQITDSSHNPIY